MNATPPRPSVTLRQLTGRRSEGTCNCDGRNCPRCSKVTDISLAWVSKRIIAQADIVHSAVECRSAGGDVPAAGATFVRTNPERIQTNTTAKVKPQSNP